MLDVPDGHGTGVGEIVETRYSDSASILVGAKLVVDPKG